MEILFTNSIENYKGLYYHFLDGFLNPDSGSEFKMYKEMFINHPELLENKYNINLMYINLEIKQYELLNLSTKLSRIIKFENDDEFITDFNKIFEYCIFQTSFNNHATSFLIRINDNKLTIGCANSGMGIEKFKTELKFRDNNKLCLPFTSHVISENINDDIKGKKILLGILKIPIIYNLVINISTHISRIKGKEVKSLAFKLNDNIIDMLFDINLLLIHLSNDSKDKFKDIGLYVTYKLNTSILDNPSEILYNKNDLDISKVSSFYSVIMNILKYIKLENRTYDNYFNNFDSLNNININIRNNIIFHYFNGEIYIKPQQSGSCSWFSLYWPLLFYNVHNNNIDEYYLFINRIYNFYYQILQKIFIIENFDKENNNYIMMKLLCSKFIDLELLENKNILNETNNFIYNRKIYFHPTSKRLKIKNNDLSKVILDLQDDTTQNLTNEIYKNIIYFLYKTYSNIEDIDGNSTEFYILSYELYLYHTTNKKELFKENIYYEELKTIIGNTNDDYNKNYIFNIKKQLIKSLN